MCLYSLVRQVIKTIALCLILVFTFFGGFNLNGQIDSGKNSSAGNDRTLSVLAKGRDVTTVFFGTGFRGSASNMKEANITGGTIVNNSMSVDSQYSAFSSVASAVIYCTSSGGNLADGITGVSFNTISNLGTTVNTGYSDFSTLSTTVEKGFTYPLNVYINTAGKNTNHQTVYIDWNGNGSFEDAGEFYSLGTARNVTNGLSSLSPFSITVPANAVTGNVRMRIQSRFNSQTIGPCQTGFDGEVEDYTLTLADPPACIAPISQPVALSLITSGNSILGNFTAPSPAVSNYLVLVSTNAAAPAAAPVNGASYAVGSAFATGYTVVDNDVNTTFVAKGLANNTRYYFYIYAFNTFCSGGPFYLVTGPLSGNTTTTNSNYCLPTTQTDSEYITKIASVGTLIDVSNVTGYSPGGFGDFTSLILATQIPGGGINLDINFSPAPAERQFIKVWVDWNRDGDFLDAGEAVYTTGTTATGNTSFGFIVPATQSPGNYRIRIKTRNFGGTSSGNSTYDSCSDYARGETEDYTISIVPDCSAKITSVSPGSACGPVNPVNLSVGVGSGVTEVRWYDALKGGNLVKTTPNGNWTTPALSTTTTYYVTAWDGICETKHRTPVVATIFPSTNITITPSVPEICGEDVKINLTAAGDFIKQTLLTQNFESGLSGWSVFSSPTNSGGGIDTPWSVKASPYQPSTTTVWKPAVNSGPVGTVGNQFAFTTSDYSYSNIVTQLISPAIDVSAYDQLILTFDHYYSAYSGDKGEIEVATNAAGTNWTSAVATYDTDLGSASQFTNAVVDLSAYKGTATLRIRFVYTAQWDDGWAIDNIKIEGTKILSTNFTWSGDSSAIFSDCSASPPPLGVSSGVCIKPPASDYESKESWTVHATATLSTGCTVTGTIVIPNNNKIWNTTTSTSWRDSNWAPNTAVPTADKCVIIKQPVNISAADKGVARNVRVKPSGKLNISGSLTVTDEVINEAAANRFVVESDANLLQISNSFNIGEVAVKRDSKMSRLDYIYWGTPVSGQPVGAFSPATVSNRFYSYNEPYDSFSVITPLTQPMIAGKAYVIRAPNNFPASPAKQLFTGVFTGIPNNGNVSVTVSKSPDSPQDTALPASTENPMVVRGKNLVGNPYPSNINLDQLTSDNPATASGVYYFWTNFPDFQNNSDAPVGQYGNYNSNHYATYNSSGGVASANNGQKPSGILRPGQGFLYQANAGGSLHFTNAIRTDAKVDRNNNPSVFISDKTRVKTASPFPERYWLKLTTPIGNFNTLLVAYIEGATNSFESRYDALYPVLSSDRFYTVSEDKELIIQGRQYPFTNNDIVQVGMSHFVKGEYKISLAEQEGVFAHGQQIYLKDKKTGIITELSQGGYSYTAEAGESRSRFEILYKPEVVLATDEANKGKLWVYREGSGFTVRSDSEKINILEVYDSAGRLILEIQPNSTRVILSSDAWANGTYLLKIYQLNKISVKKIVK